MQVVNVSFDLFGRTSGPQKRLVLFHLSNFNILRDLSSVQSVRHVSSAESQKNFDLGTRCVTAVFTFGSTSASVTLTALSSPRGPRSPRASLALCIIVVSRFLKSGHVTAAICNGPTSSLSEHFATTPVRYWTFCFEIALSRYFISLLSKRHFKSSNSQNHSVLVPCVPFTSGTSTSASTTLAPPPTPSKSELSRQFPVAQKGE